jgi:hypothetical protein
MYDEHGYPTETQWLDWQEHNAHADDAQQIIDAERDDAETEPNTDDAHDERAARVQRARQRLTFATEPAGVRLVVDGTPYRVLLETPRRKRDLAPLVALLEQATELGAAHGRCDEHAELAAALDNRSIPGHVIYGRDPDGAVTMLTGDGVTTVPVPDGLRPLYVVGQLVNALSDVFRIAGELATEPTAPPAHSARAAVPDS